MVKDNMNNKSSHAAVMATAAMDEEMEYVGHKGGSQQGLKKGPWTTTEDAILMEYVKKHGEGNWNSVQKNSGLMRCGKSCRLRWANHLRPNLKKGSFTPEEERLIIHLHSKIGNKWARMASQLPGRTDNEIKNFWNTRMKRQQRAGLPLYPNEFQESKSVFKLHHRCRRHQQKGHHKHNSNSQSSSQTSFLSSSSHNQRITNSDYNNSLPSIFNHKIMSSHSIDPFQNHLSSSFYPNQTQFKFYSDVNANNSSLAMTLYPRPPSCTSIFNKNFVGQAMPTPSLESLQSLHYNSLEFDENMSFTSLIMGGHVEPVSIVPSLNFELHQDRTPPQPATSRSISSNTNDVGGACDVDSPNPNTRNDKIMREPVMESDGNNGSLDALLHQSNHMAQKEKSNNEDIAVLVEFDHKGKRVMDNELKKDEEEEDDEKNAKNTVLPMRNICEFSSENQCDEMNLSRSSKGYDGMTNNLSEEHVEETNSMDDDLLSLLNFPSSTPPPDWDQQTRNTSNGSLSRHGHDNERLKIERDASSNSPTATKTAPPKLECALGSYYWNNMPNICEEHPHQDLHVIQRL